MLMKREALLFVTLTVLVSIAGLGCGSNTRTHVTQAAPTGDTTPVSPETPGHIALGSTPGKAARTCETLRGEKDFPVLCPRLLPRFNRPAVSPLTRGRDFSGTPEAYLVSYQTSGDGRQGTLLANGHVTVGGSATEFRLDGVAGSPWPGAKTSWFGFGLAHARVVGHSQVGSDDALVVRLFSYEEEPSMHAGHIVLIWNQGGHGYLVSLHAQERGSGHMQGRFTDDEVIRAVGAIAEGMTAPESDG